jgi:hypothetical protein
MTLGPLGAGIGWALYVFSGAVSLNTLLGLLMGGAAVGAAAGVLLAWLRLDYNSPLWLGATAVVLLLAALAGAWGGYQYGAVQEVPCCAGPEITPIAYVSLGAAAVAGGIGLALNIARQVVTSLKRNILPRQVRRSEGK